ncbi:hypothetical protein DFJ73DRAFT_279751 [Zopfochytrium polystomum]|nr:hypothetical protein DFJ73DRAFT_279751 [Zopfochytrium polystomum]
MSFLPAISSPKSSSPSLYPSRLEKKERRLGGSSTDCFAQPTNNNNVRPATRATRSLLPADSTASSQRQTSTSPTPRIQFRDSPGESRRPISPESNERPLATRAGLRGASTRALNLTMGPSSGASLASNGAGAVSSMRRAKSSVIVPASSSGNPQSSNPANTLPHASSSVHASTKPKTSIPRSRSTQKIVGDHLGGAGSTPSGMAPLSQKQGSRGAETSGATVSLTKSTASELSSEERARRRERALLRWSEAFKALKKLILATEMFALVLKRSPEEITLRRKGTSNKIAITVRDILTKPKGSRTDADMDCLDSILASISPQLADLAPPQRLRLYDTISYEFHPKNTLLSKRGATADSVYILIAGQLMSGHLSAHSADKPGTASDKKKRNHVLPATINPGAVIGVVDPKDVIAKSTIYRTEDILCTAHCDFVRVRVDDYIRAIHSHDGSAIDNIVALVNSLAIFRDASEDILLFAVQHCHILHGAPSEEVVAEGCRFENICFIAEGCCSVSKSIRFVRHSLNGPLVGSGQPRAGTSWMPWMPGMVTSAKDELRTQRVTVGELGVGASFPSLPLLPSRPAVATSQQPYISESEGTSPDVLKDLLAPLAYYTYTASHPKQTMMVAFSITSFLQMATHALVATIIQEDAKYRIPVRYLQAACLECDQGDEKSFQSSLQRILKRHEATVSADFDHQTNQPQVAMAKPERNAPLTMLPTLNPFLQDDEDDAITETRQEESTSCNPQNEQSEAKEQAAQTVVLRFGNCH